MRIYIAGGMRGYEKCNFSAFDEAAALGRALGHEIVSPAEMDRALGFNENTMDETASCLGGLGNIVIRDIEAIRGCDAIAMLPGWEMSVGARAEYAEAKWLNLLILSASDFQPLVVAADGNDLCDIREQQQQEIRNGEFVVKDSGERRIFPTGAQRDTGSGKGFFHLIPYYPMERLAQLYEAGARKYGKNNWRKGIPCSVFLDSAARHLLKLADGWADEDHAAAVMWNVCGLIWTEKQAKDGKLPVELLDHLERE